jgi:hypothetical protein
MSLWSNFWLSVEEFFSAAGTTFLNSIKAAWPALQQELMNFLILIVQDIVNGISNGTIPLPVLAAKSGATPDEIKVALGNQKRDLAFNLIKQKLATMPNVPSGVTNSQIYSAIEICYQIYQVNASGNHGNFPGGNSNA